MSLTCSDPQVQAKARVVDEAGVCGLELPGKEKAASLIQLTQLVQPFMALGT